MPVNAADTFGRVIEAAPCGMLVLDAAQRILFVNAQLLQMFGYARDELVGQGVGLLVPERSRTDHARIAAQYAQDPTTRRMGPGRDLTGRHRDGTEFAVEIGLNPVELDQGPCVLATVIDVTERKHAEQRLRRAKEDLEQFAFAAAHDLRTPLRGIGDLADWVREDLGPGLPPSVRNNLQRLQTRVHHMDQLLSRMLDYAHAGTDQNPPETTSVPTLLREQIELADPAGRATLRIDCRLEYILVRATPLGTALRNLIGNAVRHSDRPDPQVDILVRSDGPYVLFEVIDNGPGVPAGARERVFRLFQRQQGGEGGTGIGLALVKRISESHGGRVQVTDRSDGERGARFLLWWPQSIRRNGHA